MNCPFIIMMDKLSYSLVCLVIPTWVAVIACRAEIYYIRSKVHKRFPVTNALLTQPLGLETSCMARFEGFGTRMSENSTELGNYKSVAMET